MAKSLSKNCARKAKQSIGRGTKAAIKGQQSLGLKSAAEGIILGWHIACVQRDLDAVAKSAKLPPKWQLGSQEPPTWSLGVIRALMETQPVYRSMAECDD